MPTIYVEKKELSDSIKYISDYSARRIRNFFVTYVFSFQNGPYQFFKKLILKNIKNEHYDSSYDDYGSFEICIKSENHSDSMHAYSLKFLEELKNEINEYGSNELLSFLWMIPAINELEKYSKHYIKYDEFNKPE